jgi:hypothetical protein
MGSNFAITSALYKNAQVTLEDEHKYFILNYQEEGTEVKTNYTPHSGSYQEPSSREHQHQHQQQHQQQQQQTRHSIKQEGV